MKILYVENNLLFFNAVKKEFLSSYEIDNVMSVSEAKTAFTSNEYNLLLVDYDLDDSKGEEFVSFVRSQNQLIPIVAVSSHQEGNNAMLSVGATAVCEKLQFRKINDVIEQVCQSIE